MRPTLYWLPPLTDLLLACFCLLPIDDTVCLPLLSIPSYPACLATSPSLLREKFITSNDQIHKRKICSFPERLLFEEMLILIKSVFIKLCLWLMFSFICSLESFAGLRVKRYFPLLNCSEMQLNFMYWSCMTQQHPICLFLFNFAVLLKIFFIDSLVLWRWKPYP